MYLYLNKSTWQKGYHGMKTHNIVPSFCQFDCLTHSDGGNSRENAMFMGNWFPIKSGGNCRANIWCNSSWEITRQINCPKLYGHMHVPICITVRQHWHLIMFCINKYKGKTISDYLN